MIFNVANQTNDFVYYCNGGNDNIKLNALISNLRTRGFEKFTIDIVGTFRASGNFAVDNTGYSTITLDFTRCQKITSNLSVKNVRVIGLSLENSTVTGISGSNNLISGCNIIVNSSTASAYGIDVTGSFVENSKFYGETDSTLTTTSGNGGIGGGYFVNCQFIGFGAVKGQGFYIRGGQWATMLNCVFRGYTKDTTNGWGGGLMGQSNDATTVSLLGINCNQVAVSGFTQTKSFELLNGYGVYSGTFFTAVNVGTNLTSLGAYNRNRT